jgi:translocation and assembly module TamB
MRRFLLILLAVVVILIIGLVIAARLYVRSDRVRKQVAGRLETIYGGPVVVEDADIGVVGDSTLRGLRFYEPGQAGQEPWVTVGTVKTDVSALDLLRGVMPKEITLGDPTVTLRLDSEGRLLTQLPEAGQGETAPPVIHVEGGKVTVRQEGRPDMVVSGVRADLRPDGGQVKITGTVSDSEWGEWSLDGSMDRGAGSLTATLKTDRADVTQEKLLRIPVVPAAVWKEVEASGPTPVEFTFRHDPRAQRVNHYRVELHPDGAAITLPTLALETRDVRGGVIVEDELVTLTKANGKALGGELGVDGTLDFRGKENVYHLAVTARGLDVGQVPEAWGLDERLRRLGGRLSGKADLTVRYDGEVHTSGEGKGEITGVMLGGKATTVELRLSPTRKGFGLGQPQPQGRLPGTVPSTRYSVLSTQLAALILLQPPAPESSSLVRDATDAVTGGAKAAAGGFLDLGRKAVGSLPKGDVLKPKPAGTPPTYLDVSLNLKDVDLARLVEDLQLKVPFEVSGRLSMKVQASLPVNQANDLKLYKVTGTATLPTFSLSGVDMKDVTAKVRYDNGVLRLEELRGRLAGGKADAGTFQGTARLGVIPEGDLTADLTLTDIPLAQILRAAGIKEEVAGAVSGSANLRAPAGKLRDPAAWEGSGKLKSDRVGAFGWALTDAAATVRVARGRLTVSDVTAKLEGAPVSGSGEAKLTAPYTYEGKLELARGDLASVQRLAPSVRPPLTVAGQFGITAEVNGTLSPFTAKVSGTGTGKDVKVEKVSVGRLDFRWSVGDDVLKLTDVKAGLYGGEVTGSAAVPLIAKREGKLDLRVKDVDAGDLVRDVPAVPLRLEGKVSGTIKGTMPAADGERRFDGDVDLSAPKLRVQGLPTEKLTGTVTYRKGVGEYHLKGGLLGGTFELEGQIPPRPAEKGAAPAKPPPADSRLEIRGAQLGRLGEALGARGSLDQLHGRVDLDVDFHLDPADYQPVGTGAVTVTRLRWGDQVIADSLRGDVVLSDGEARVRNLSGEVGGGTVRGQIVLRLREPSRSRFNVTLDSADAARVLAPWPSLAANVTGSIDARLRGTLGRTWTGGGDVVLTRGKVAGVEVSEWRVPLRFEAAPARGRAEITVDEMSAQVAHGRVTGRGTFGFGSDTHTSGNVRFSGVDMRALLRPLTDSTAIGGGLASGRIDFSGNNVRSLDDVTATVDASFAQAQAFQMPVLSSLVPFVARGQSGSTFQSGQLRGRLANGVFRVQGLSLSGNVLSLFAQGNVTTAGRLNLDVTATTGLVGAGSGVLRLLGLRLPAFGPVPLSLLVEATSFFSNTSIHLIVTGTVRTPVVRIEPLSLLTDEAARFLLLRAAGTP